MKLSELKQKFLQAMKDKAKERKEFIAFLIGTIENDKDYRVSIGDEQKEETVILNIFTKLRNSLNKAENDFKGKTDEKSLAFIEKTKTELDILAEFMPKMLSEQELSNIISNLKQQGLTQKDVFVKLKQEYNGLYDGSAVSKLFAKL